MPFKKFIIYFFKKAYFSALTCNTRFDLRFCFSLDQSGLYERVPQHWGYYWFGLISWKNMLFVYTKVITITIKKKTLALEYIAYSPGCKTCSLTKSTKIQMPKIEKIQTSRESISYTLSDKFYLLDCLALGKLKKWI